MKVFTTKTLAESLGVSVQTIWVEVDKGRLKKSPMSTNRVSIYEEADVAEFLLCTAATKAKNAGLEKESLLKIIDRIWGESHEHD